jgi:hypothetical protein
MRASAKSRDVYFDKNACDHSSLVFTGTCLLSL